MNIGSEFGVVSAVFGALFILSLAYNCLVQWLQANGYEEGYTALLVAGGVFYTLLGIGMLDYWLNLEGRVFGISAGAFIASGLPMIVGSIWRYVRARAEYLREKLTHK